MSSETGRGHSLDSARGANPTDPDNVERAVRHLMMPEAATCDRDMSRTDRAQGGLAEEHEEGKATIRNRASIASSYGLSGALTSMFSLDQGPQCREAQSTAILKSTRKALKKEDFTVVVLPELGDLC